MQFKAEARLDVDATLSVGGLWGPRSWWGHSGSNNNLKYSTLSVSPTLTVNKVVVKTIRTQASWCHTYLTEPWAIFCATFLLVDWTTLALFVTIGTFSYFLFNGLSTFSWVHLILSRHVIIISQGTLSFIYFLTRSVSPLCYHSLLLISMLCMAMPSFFSSILMPHTSHMLCFHSMHSLLNFRTHSPGLRVCLMHTISVDSIQSCTNNMSSI